MSVVDPILKPFYTERITDIVNELCIAVKSYQGHQGYDKTQLVKLYNYHKSKSNIYPDTNWHSNRLQCMSCIANKLQDRVKIWESTVGLLNSN